MNEVMQSVTISLRVATSLKITSVPHENCIHLMGHMEITWVSHDHLEITWISHGPHGNHVHMGISQTIWKSHGFHMDMSWILAEMLHNRDFQLTL